MRIAESYYHRIDKPLDDNQELLLGEIRTTVDSCPYTFESNSPSRIKSFFNQSLNSQGWVNNVRIDYRIQATINFVKNDIAFVIQLGNAARVYADLIKLSYLIDKEIVNLGVIGVTKKSESKILGANYVNYERLTKELEVYSEIIYSPLIILGLSN